MSDIPSSAQKMPRVSTAEQRDALKTATRHSLRRVGAEAFSRVTRVGASDLSKYCSLAHESTFMPVDVLVDLQHEYQGIATPLLELLANLAGFKLVPLDPEEGSGDEARVEDVSHVIKEGGEAKAAALSAIGVSCLQTVRTARKEVGEGYDAYGALARKLARQEQRILRRGA